jgi:hypothetical protein
MCDICGTEENIVHSGIDAFALSCLDRVGAICYDCANEQLGILND